MKEAVVAVPEAACTTCMHPVQRHNEKGCVFNGNKGIAHCSCVVRYRTLTREAVTVRDITLEVLSRVTDVLFLKALRMRAYEETLFLANFVVATVLPKFREETSEVAQVWSDEEWVVRLSGALRVDVVELLRDAKAGCLPAIPWIKLAPKLGGPTRAVSTAVHRKLKL